MTKQTNKTPPAANFKVGEKVRVKHGVRDVDYPDMPLGGWAGTVKEVHDARHLYRPMEQRDDGVDPSA